eukprot:5645868-Pyramimonas_sp.AAC.1
MPPARPMSTVRGSNNCEQICRRHLCLRALSCSKMFSPWQLVETGVLRDVILEIDVSELRSKFLSVNIPLPQCDQDVLRPSASSCSLPTGEFYCGLMRTDGNIRIMTFPT